MIDSIFIAMSGLAGHQSGLNVISNNVANLNTPGFKGSSVDFADAFAGDAGGQAGPHTPAGRGLGAARSTLDLRAGENRQTGRDLDLSLEGAGFFVARDGNGALRYTRAGSFEFDSAGRLVGRGHGLEIMARDASGQLVPLALSGLRSSAPKASTEVRLSGNLSSADVEHTIDPVLVYDRLGGAHSLRLEFKPKTGAGVAPGSWIVTAFEGSRELARGETRFVDGRAAPGASPLALSLAFERVEAGAVSLVLGDEVTSFSSGSESTLALKAQDGHAAGTIASLRFDERGVLKLGYSNGQQADGARLALAELRDDGALQPLGDGLFAYDGAEPPAMRETGDGLRVSGGSLEASNVDLTQEFSTLILMQRGYQASSQVISTANDMLQELFDMKGRR